MKYRKNIMGELLLALLSPSLSACSIDKNKVDTENLVLVQIRGMQIHDEGVDVLLESEDERGIAISIGHVEGKHLLLAVKNQKSDRPLPYDLLENLLEHMQGKVQRLVIHSLKENIYYANLLIEAEKEFFLLDCRPSDGMIIATRLKIPIYVNSEIIEEKNNTSI